LRRLKDWAQTGKLEWLKMTKNNRITLADNLFPVFIQSLLAWMLHELLSRDHEDGLASGQPQGVGLEAYLNGTPQGPTPEDARKDGHIRDRSK
jgi:hypothetical protein